MVRPQLFPLASLTRWLLSEGSDHRRLTGGGEQRAVLGPDVGQAVAESMHDGLDADVDEHPLGWHQLYDADRVVQTVAARAHPECLADPERHHVADDGQRRRRHL